MLSPEEQAELDSLKKDVGQQQPKQQAPSLSPEEQAELNSLRKDVAAKDPNLLSGQARLDYMRSGKDQSALGRATMDFDDNRVAIHHGANSAMMGYLPQVRGALAYAGGNDYLSSRDAEVQKLANEEKERPGAALTGQVGGALIGGLLTPVPGLGAAKGIIGGIAKGAASGAIQGGLQNPGDVVGKINPLQAGERYENAKMGAGIGAVVGGTTEATRKGLGYLAKAPESLRNIEEQQAVRASGPDLKKVRVIEDRDMTNELGRFARDKGIVQAGDTAETIAEKAGKIKEEAGKKLDKIYKDVVESFNKDGSATNLSKAEIEKINQTGFNPARDKDAILSEVKKAMGDKEGKSGALARLETYFDQLIEDHGDKVLDPKRTQNVKTELDHVINYERNPQTKTPAVESAFKETRRIVSKKIDEEIDKLGKLSGKPDALEQLKAANKEYGLSKTFHAAASDQYNREIRNQWMGLTDKIAGGSGTVAGTVAAGMMGGNDPTHMGEGAIAGTIAGAALNHASLRYGPGLVSAGAGRLSPLMRGPAVAAGYAKGLIPNAGLMSRTAVNLKRKGLLDDRQD